MIVNYGYVHNQIIMKEEHKSDTRGSVMQMNIDLIDNAMHEELSKTKN